jgi:alkanesulfonate monooxygenase SsuD/methylene tetrahydromethanopterin reductase-like flavin-dependent oxidoreductase (luciferase family)
MLQSDKHQISALTEIIVKGTLRFNMADKSAVEFKQGTASDPTPFVAEYWRKSPYITLAVPSSGGAHEVIYMATSQGHAFGGNDPDAIAKKIKPMLQALADHIEKRLELEEKRAGETKH